MIRTLLSCAMVLSTFGALYAAGFHLAARLFLLFVAVIAFLSLSRTQGERQQRLALLGTCGALAVAYITKYAIDVYYSPGVWDFLVFFLDGNVVANGGNPYNPTDYRLTLESLSIPVVPGGDFIEEVVDVGFKYFPPAILMMLPLGWVDFLVGRALWMVVVLGIAGLLSVWLAHRQLDDGSDRAAAFSLVAVLICVMPATRHLVMNQQFLFIGLVLLLAIQFRTQNTLALGVLTAVLVGIKPVFIFAPGYLFIRREYRALVASLLAFGILCLLTFFVIGADAFMSFFGSDFVSRVPRWQYAQTENQSLLPFLIRTFGDNTDLPPLSRPDFRALAAIIVAITVGSAFLAQARSKQLWVLPVIVSGVLLTYPGSLISYGVLLTIPLVAGVVAIRSWDSAQQFWSFAGLRLTYNSIGGATLLVLVLGLQADYAFFSSLIVWGFVVLAILTPRFGSVTHQSPSS